MSILPLGRFRMLDLSRQLPGPFCSTLLADLGMDVLVVSSPLDPMGGGIPFLGRNKRSLTLNLKSDEGREIFQTLADEADVVLEGARPGVAARLGVDYATLSARNPRLIYCSISGYGQDGPYRDRVGHDVNYLGQAGVLEFIGETARPPVIPGVQIADIGGGALMATVGILTALLAREQTGRGQMVDIAMLDGIAAFNVYHTLMWQLAGSLPQRGQQQLTGKYPCYAIYETADGRHLTIGAFEAHFWATLCRAVGHEDWIADQWAEGARREEIFAEMRRIFRGQTLAHWQDSLGSLDVCFGSVATLEEVFADPQLRHRGMIVETDGSGGTWKSFGTPVKLSDTPATIRSAPAGFGEHTDAVLGGLGYSPERIASLRERGVI